MQAAIDSGELVEKLKPPVRKPSGLPVHLPSKSPIIPSAEQSSDLGPEPKAGVMAGMGHWLADSGAEGEGESEAESDFESESENEAEEALDEAAWLEVKSVG